MPRSSPASNSAPTQIAHGIAEVSQLRIVTSGSVDDGKSTLIGRLLYDCRAVHEDHLKQLGHDSKRFGTQGERLDFALLLDGLMAEREQGITIDVAYRYFSTKKRKFIIADAPGHEQYTRNMVSGASTADAAILLVDARKGILPQTRRHTHIIGLLGVPHLVLAVNKMDMIDWSESAFNAIAGSYKELAARLGIKSVICIPVSALGGDNVAAPSSSMPWYRGPSLLAHLESLEASQSFAPSALRLPVQMVLRPDQHFRGFAGRILGGELRPGQEVRVLPSGLASRITRIVTDGGDLPRAERGQSVLVTLADEIDVGRGDMLVAQDSPAQVGDRVNADLVWMHETPLEPGRSCLVKIAAATVAATIPELQGKIDIETMAHSPAQRLSLNDIGSGVIAFERPVAFDTYADNRDTGSLIIIDRMSGETLGAGMIRAGSTSARNVVWYEQDIDRTAHAALKGQKAAVLWFTGIPSSGKSTIANRLEKKLYALGRHTYILDGDNVRHGLNRDLGFAAADRVENIRRIAEVARLMADAGLIVLVASISPFRADRRMARGLLPKGEFVEIFIDTPLSEAEARDPKGHYARARRGEIRNFTGIDSPYEIPEAPELRIDTLTTPPDEAVSQILAYLRKSGCLGG